MKRRQKPLRDNLLAIVILELYVITFCGSRSNCFLEVWPRRISLASIVCQVKVEAESAATKKRKTEWQAALKKMPGDVTFAKAG